MAESGSSSDGRLGAALRKAAAASPPFGAWATQAPLRGGRNGRDEPGCPAAAAAFATAAAEGTAGAMKRKTAVAGGRRNSAPASHSAMLPPAVKKTRSSAAFEEVSDEDAPPPPPYSQECCLQITGEGGGVDDASWERLQQSRRGVHGTLSGCTGKRLAFLIV